jgi:hypothetical protein
VVPDAVLGAGSAVAAQKNVEDVESQDMSTIGCHCEVMKVTKIGPGYELKLPDIVLVVCHPSIQ